MGGGVILKFPFDPVNGGVFFIRPAGTVSGGKPGSEHRLRDRSISASIQPQNKYLRRYSNETNDH